MRRRDISGMIFATGAASALVAAPARSQSCTVPCFPITPAESAAGVTPTAYEELPGTFERYGAQGNNAAADTAAIQAAFRVGGDIKGRPGRTYKMSGPAYLATSDTTVDLRGCTVVMESAAAPFVYIGWASGSTTFVKTDRVKFFGGRIIGAVTAASPAYGITVVEPPTTPYESGAGCDDLELSGMSVSGFTGGFIATGASNIKIHGCSFRGMIYHISLGAGGYGVIFQTCFDVVVEGNRFKADSADRHAIYASANSSLPYDNANVCKNIVLSGNVIDWSGSSGVTGFEAAIEVRSAERIVITGNVIDGSFGGIDYDACNASGFGVAITGNVIRGVRAGSSQRNAIGVFRTSGAFTTSNVVIAGNAIQFDDNNVNGIHVDHCVNATVEGNTIDVGYGIDSIIFAHSRNIRVGANSIQVSGMASSHVAFAGTCSDITVGRGTHGGSVGSEYKYYTIPTNLRFDYPRTVAVSWNAGAATVADPDNIVISQASDVFGFTVTFENWVVDLDTTNLSFTSAASNVCSLYRRAAAGQTVTIGVKDFAGADLPAGSNIYSVAITLKS